MEGEDIASARVAPEPTKSSRARCPVDNGTMAQSVPAGHRKPNSPDDGGTLLRFGKVVGRTAVTM